MFDSQNKLYKPNQEAAADLSKFYPNAAAQLFPIVTGLLPNPKTNPRAKSLWAAFKTQHPNWATVAVDDFPWTLIAYAAALMGEYWQAATFFNTIKTKYIDTGRNYTYYITEAGWIIRAANHILKNP